MSSSILGSGNQRLRTTRNSLLELFIIAIFTVSIKGVAAYYSGLECPADIRLLALSRFQKYPEDFHLASSLLYNHNEDIYHRESFRQTEGPRLCPIAPNPQDHLLLAHPRNCSLFYKCDWSEPVLFECPDELHFNNILQICDWPWQAGCDDNWTRCPRPGPICPALNPRPLYLPHQNLCDEFYQCNWGRPYLQKCPAGLHFNQNSNVCDWPHSAKCNGC